MFLYTALIEPFWDYDFMQRALVASLALSLGCGPIGVFLVLRRMSLIGDGISHAILPGTALGFFWAGFSLWAMSLGGLLTGLVIVILAGIISRITPLKEDAHLAAFYLISLSLGVLLISKGGSHVDLLHFLFGTILAVDEARLYLLGALSSITLVVLAMIYRPLVIECFDPGFLRRMGYAGGVSHILFLVLVVLNLVSAFQALGTLMALGLMMIPAISARFWSPHLETMLGLSVLFAWSSSVLGLLLSYHLNLPSGPSIVLCSGGLYLFCVIFGPYGGVLNRFFPKPHYHEGVV